MVDAAIQYHETGRIDGGEVLAAAMATTAVVVTAVVAAPVVVGMAGEALMGFGMATGSTTVFSAGVSTYEAATGLGVAIYGVSTASNASTGTPSPNSVINSETEVRSPNPVRPTTATDQWDDFLGDWPYSDIGPNQVRYDDRIFSSDGTRSIRYGNHEMTYSHYHEEIWTYNSNNDTFDLTNTYRHVQTR